MKCVFMNLVGIKDKNQRTQVLGWDINIQWKFKIVEGKNLFIPIKLPLLFTLLPKKWTSQSQLYNASIHLHLISFRLLSTEKHAQTYLNCPIKTPMFFKDFSA
jgi:hypothetical protein